MRSYIRLAACLILSVAGPVIANDALPIDALQAEFPHGIHWKVAVDHPDGTSRGMLEMPITSDHAKSCLGEIGDGFRVEFIGQQALSPPLPIAGYGIAKFVAGKVEIDLTGGACDGYSVMDGVVMSNGSSTGDMHTFGPFGGHNVGTYRASVK